MISVKKTQKLTNFIESDTVNLTVIKSWWWWDLPIIYLQLVSCINCLNLLDSSVIVGRRGIIWVWSLVVPWPLSFLVLFIFCCVPILAEKLFECCLLLGFRRLFIGVLLEQALWLVWVNSEHSSVVQCRVRIQRAVVWCLSLTQSLLNMIADSHSAADVVEIGWQFRCDDFIFSLDHLLNNPRHLCGGRDSCLLLLYFEGQRLVIVFYHVDLSLVSLYSHDSGMLLSTFVCCDSVTSIFSRTVLVWTISVLR